MYYVREIPYAVTLFIQGMRRACVRVHWTLTINRSVVRMPEEEAVTYHYRVLRRPRVVAFSHANLRSLAAPRRDEAARRAGRRVGGREGGRREKAKTTYESNNARQLVTREVDKNATFVSSLVRSFARSPAEWYSVDVDTFHFSRTTRLISSEISKDQGRDRSEGELDGEGGREREEEKEKERASGRKGRKGRSWRGERGKRKVEKDGANS